MLRKKILIVGLLTMLFGGVVVIFWKQEMRYLLPTPVPQGYRLVSPDQPVNLEQYLDLPLSKPVLLHFFNIDCPCSRFNIDHFRDLVNRYSDSLDFYVVLPEKNSQETATQFQEQYELSLPVLIDQNEQLSAACGVYSTPQAVVINQQSKLYYRGNYNRARYCTARSTSYAELTLKSLLKGAPPPIFVELATQSYGCQLSSQKKSLFNFRF